MKVCLILLCLIGTSLGLLFRKANPDYLEKQQKILKLLVGIGAEVEDSADHVPEEVPFYAYTLFKRDSVVDRFEESYFRGMVPRDGVFSMTSGRNKQDTLRLFDIFFFAKDFNTFYKAADWASRNIHPVQFYHALTLAVYHRDDLTGVAIPPIHEIFPAFFVREEIMNSAMRAKLHGINRKNFIMNSTSWKWSWHRDMTSGVYNSGNKWNGDDREAGDIYFREDPALGNFIDKFFKHFAPSVSGERPKFKSHFHRRGEMFFFFTRWLVARYAMERYSRDMPPIPFIDLKKPLVGYNPQVSDNRGRALNARPEGIRAEPLDYFGYYSRKEAIYQDAIDKGMIFSVDDENFYAMNEEQGIEVLSTGLFGLKSEIHKGLYQPLFDLFMNAADELFDSSNNRELTVGPFAHLFTAPRDPLFWTMLNRINMYFIKLNNKFEPYTEKELHTPGVKIDSFEMDPLATFSTRKEFEITNGIPMKDRSERIETKYTVSNYRLDHKPFNFKLKVTSDSEREVMVRIYLGPVQDAEMRRLSLDQSRHLYYPLYQAPIDLEKGENEFERMSSKFPLYGETIGYRTLYEKVNKSIDTSDPYVYEEFDDGCKFPANLMLPHGSPTGIKYKLFVMVSPLEKSEPDVGYGSCGFTHMIDSHSAGFPFDRRIPYENVFDAPNIHFQDVKIVHRELQDGNKV